MMPVHQDMHNWASQENKPWQNERHMNPMLNQQCCAYTGSSRIQAKDGPNVAEMS